MSKVKHHKQKVTSEKPLVVCEEEDYKPPESRIIVESAPQWMIDTYYAIRRFLLTITFQSHKINQIDDDDD